MAQITKVEGQTELKCPAAKFFEIFTSKAYMIPKICPEKINNIHVLEGDWVSVGSVKLWNFVAAGNPESGKERIEAIDEHNKTATFRLLEGEALKYYKSLKSYFQVTDKSEGTLVKWTIEYEKQNEDIPPPNMYLGLVVSVSEDIDAYLLKP